MTQPSSTHSLSLLTQHDFWRAIPTRRDITSHLAFSWTSETEIENPQLAVFVDGQVAGLEIPVDDTSRVNVLQTAKHLVNKELNVIVGQSLRANDVVQIGAHQMGHQVDVGEGLQGVTMVESVEKSDDVLMVHVLEQTELAERSLCMSRRLEGTVKFLDRNLGIVGRVDGGAERIIIE